MANDAATRAIRATGQNYKPIKTKKNMKVTKKDFKRIDLEKIMNIIIDSNDILTDNLIHAIKYGDEEKIVDLIREKFKKEGINEFISELKPKLQNINNDYKKRNIRENLLNEINFYKYLSPLL